MKRTDSVINFEMVRDAIGHFGETMSVTLLDNSFNVPVSGRYLDDYAAVMEAGYLNRRKLATLEQTKSEEKTFEGEDISELESCADEEIDWLVDGTFSADQPTLFGAKSKCLKTTLLIDLAIAFATGGKWLGKFPVSEPWRVLFYTDEANYRAVARRLKKACASHGVTFADLRGMLRVEAIEFPKLPNIIHCRAVGNAVEKYGIDVVIVDPLYRGMTSDMDTNRMAEIGDAIVSFSQWCQPASLIMSHHTTKASARELGSPPDLEDMTGAGIAESFGNWWLMGRNAKYEWDWKHDLCVQFGGRDEQAGGRRILFDESTWTAEVTNLHEFIGEQQEAEQQARDNAKREAENRKQEAARGKILTAVRNVKSPQAKTAIRDASGQSGGTFGFAFAELVREETLAIRAYVDGAGRLKAEGYIHKDYAVEYDQNQAAE